jgi:two-component system chemotaxis response regulator CheB
LSKIRVLVVDDSALVRKILSDGLSLDPSIEVVGTAGDPYLARDKIVELRPDVLTLDVEMPKMDGVEFLRRLMPQYPLPVLMVSALTERGAQVTLDALEAGAVDFVTKPGSDLMRGLNQMLAELREKVKVVSRVNVSSWKQSKAQRIPKPTDSVPKNRHLAGSTEKVIAIGASTGGTEAIRKVITGFPADTPGVVIVQHMPPGFTRMFAERLDTQCVMHVKEAEDGDRVSRGLILIAPGDRHLIVRREGGMFVAHLEDSGKVCGHRPSVEVLFNSLADCAGRHVVGAVLTGMGADGSGGLLRMRQAGARTLSQDEATSVVFGMPREAFQKGGSERMVPIDEIGSAILELVAGV